MVGKGGFPVRWNIEIAIATLLEWGSRVFIKV